MPAGTPNLFRSFSQRFYCQLKKGKKLEKTGKRRVGLYVAQKSKAKGKLNTERN